MSRSYLRVVGHMRPDEYVFFDDRDPGDVRRAVSQARSLARVYTTATHVERTERVVVWRLPVGPYGYLPVVGEGAPS